MWDRALMRSVPWLALKWLIEGLLTRPMLGYVRVPVDEKHERFEPIWPNRILRAYSARAAA